MKYDYIFLVFDDEPKHALARWIAKYYPGRGRFTFRSQWMPQHILMQFDNEAVAHKACKQLGYALKLSSKSFMLTPLPDAKRLTRAQRARMEGMVEVPLIGF